MDETDVGRVVAVSSPDLAASFTGRIIEYDMRRRRFLVLDDTGYWDGWYPESELSYAPDM